MTGAAGRAGLPLAIAALALVVGCAPAHHRAQAPGKVPTLRTDHEEPELIRVVHVVKAGETLYRIAKAYELTADELMAANGISDPRTLAIGQELLIPGASEVREVSPPPSVSSTTPRRPGDPKPPAEVKTVSVREDPEASRPPDPRRGTLSWPLRGVLYGRFGKKGKEPHDGVDLAAPAGTPVKTAAEGRVLYAGEQRGYGLLVIIEHADDLVTLYAHNRDLRVKTGQKVRPGQVIATVGNSGRTSGPHLHFEVRKSGMPVDPMLYLGPVPPAP